MSKHVIEDKLAASQDKLAALIAEFKKDVNYSMFKRNCERAIPSLITPFQKKIPFKYPSSVLCQHLVGVYKEEPCVPVYPEGLVTYDEATNLIPLAFGNLGFTTENYVQLHSLYRLHDVR